MRRCRWRAKEWLWKPVPDEKGRWYNLNKPTRRRTSSIARTGRDVAALEDIPNVGPAIASDLRQLGITSPIDLPGRDPYDMYEDLCRKTGKRHDACLLDTFIAAVRFMEGEPKRAWWKYTAQRKRELAKRSTTPR
jgi:hypothetical protein